MSTITELKISNILFIHSISKVVEETELSVIDVQINSALKSFDIYLKEIVLFQSDIYNCLIKF